MINHLIFYTLIDDQVYLLAGQQRAKYAFINYQENHPLDLVDTFNHEFGNLLMSPEKLLDIINQTTFPHFIISQPCESIYLIKIDNMTDQQLNTLIHHYQIDHHSKAYDHHLSL